MTIDKSMGISICQTCDAKYAGYQDICIQNKRFEDTSYYGKYIEEKFTNHKITIKQCYGHTSWDLNNQFYEQKEFFNLLSSL